MNQDITKNNIGNKDKSTDQIISSTISKLNLDKLPEEVKISTMTLCCRLDTIFNCRNIARFIDLTYDGILSVKCGKDEDQKTNRSLLQKKQKMGKKKKKKNVFYNQVSMYVSVKGKNKKPVSLKLFSNGAIQMTGCKTMDNALDALNKIFPELQKIKAIIVSTKDDELKIVEKPFVTNPKVLNMKFVKDLKISMINSNFFMQFKVDRAKLYNLLLEQKYDVTFDPGKHACVNVKFCHVEKLISIFIFERGSIIITGAQNCNQILDAYNFINKYLLMNYNSIVKNDSLTNASIIKYLDQENMKEEFMDENIIEIPDSEDDSDFGDDVDLDAELEGINNYEEDQKPKKFLKNINKK